LRIFFFIADNYYQQERNIQEIKSERSKTHHEWNGEEKVMMEGGFHLIPC